MRVFFLKISPSAKHISISSYLSLTDHLDATTNIKQMENMRSMMFSGHASSVKGKSTSVYKNVLTKELLYYFPVRK